MRRTFGYSPMEKGFIIYPSIYIYLALSCCIIEGCHKGVSILLNGYGPERDDMVPQKMPTCYFAQNKYIYKLWIVRRRFRSQQIY